MTHVLTNVLARIHLDIDKLFGSTSSKPAKSALDHKQFPSGIMHHIHNTSKESKPSQRFTLTYGFWRALFNALSNHKLTFELLSDKPSDLDDGLIWLSHERVTGLLDEQGLPYSDISPILFHLIMSATNQLYPGALIDEGSIESERSLVTNNGEWHGEHRYCFCINVDKLPISKNNIRSISDAELG